MDVLVSVGSLALGRDVEASDEPTAPHLHGLISSTLTPFGNLSAVNPETQEHADEAGTEPDIERSPPTRELKRRTTLDTGRNFGPLVGFDTNGSSVAKSGTSFKLSGDALLNEERGRLRVTAQVMMGVACLGLLLAPVMGGDPFAKKVFIAGLSSAVVTMAVLLRNSYVSGYNANSIGVGGVSLAMAYACTLYYIGSASQAAMTGALGLYIFCLGGSSAWSLAVYSALAVPHLVLATLIMSRIVPDRGLVVVSGLPLTDQIALQGCVQAVYAVALVAGRRSRRKLERVFGDLESAARLIAQRDALLNEAKRDLERAVRVGGEGRFSEQVVGSFRLGNIIGRGGMGEVYDAVHIETNEAAAVKLLSRNVVSDPNSVARFAREAKAASAFDSPYIVRVLEVPDDDARGAVYRHGTAERRRPGEHAEARGTPAFARARGDRGAGRSRARRGTRRGRDSSRHQAAEPVPRPSRRCVAAVEGARLWCLEVGWPRNAYRQPARRHA